MAEQVNSNGMQKPVVVVGAGLAGLVCARRLEQAGRAVLVLDAGDGPGGRMRTDVVDGFSLDRGFQVFFEAYPNAKLELDYQVLRLRDFEPGCLVFDGKKMREVHRENILQTVFGKWVPMADLLRLHQLGDELDDMTEEQVWSLDDEPVETFLKSRKISSLAVERFIRPFFGGVFLDTSLDVSSRAFAFYWQMLDRAPATIPAAGMQAIPDQIAAGIQPESMRFGVRVDSLVRTDGKVTGVRLDTGEIIEAEMVVVATDQPNCTMLTGVGTPQDGKPCTTIHFASSERPVYESILMVNGSGVGLVNHVACMTNASKELAPAGQYLVSASILGNPRTPDSELAKSVRYELKSWFPNLTVDSWRPLRVDRIPYSQMPQPVGFMDHLTPVDPEPGLLIAGEHTAYAGIDGAVLSGQRAAAMVLNPDRELVQA